MLPFHSPVQTIAHKSKLVIPMAKSTSSNLPFIVIYVHKMQLDRRFKYQLV